jgi:hypothetical protein
MTNAQNTLPNDFCYISAKGGYIGNIAWCNTGEAGYYYPQDRWGFVRTLPAFPNNGNWWGPLRGGWVYNLFTRGNVF